MSLATDIEHGEKIFNQIFQLNPQEIRNVLNNIFKSIDWEEEGIEFFVLSKLSVEDRPDSIKIQISKDYYYEIFITGIDFHNSYNYQTLVTFDENFNLSGYL